MLSFTPGIRITRRERRAASDTKSLTASISSAVTSTTSRLFYHLRTLWIILSRCINCIGLPMTLFGVMAAASSRLTNVESPHIFTIMSRMPIIFSWLCVVTLHFSASNQHRTESIIEDTLNKPWRAIPSGRITQQGMIKLLIFLIPLEMIYSWSLGVLLPTVAHAIFVSMYDDLKLADTGYIMRNVLIGFGYACYGFGTAAIASGLGISGLNAEFYKWILIIGLQITTTIQAQDLPDVVGDKEKGRRTMPLVLGDRFTRWSLVIPASFWTLFCTYWWDCSVISGPIMICCGAYYCSTVLYSKSIEDDEWSWQMWSAWSACLFCLPAAHAFGI